MVEWKEKVKQHISSEGLLGPNFNPNQLIVLYIGRFQYLKGMEFCKHIAYTLI